MERKRKKKYFKFDCIEKQAYYSKVWDLTEKNSHKVENIHLRGQDFHIDHIIPISMGFKYQISEQIIGSYENLQIISRKENFLKNHKKTLLVELKLRYFGIDFNSLNIRKPKKQKHVIPVIEPVIEQAVFSDNPRSLLYYTKHNMERLNRP